MPQVSPVLRAFTGALVCLYLALLPCGTAAHAQISAAQKRKAKAAATAARKTAAKPSKITATHGKTAAKSSVRTSHPATSTHSHPPYARSAAPSRRSRQAARTYTRQTPTYAVTPPTHPNSVAPTHPYAVAPPTEVVPDSEPASTTAGPVTPTGSPFLYLSNLNPFFAALAGHQQGAPDAQDTIRILQFGDSHTAADIFTGAVRASLQAHFGDGGLGFQYPGHPFAGYHLAGSSRSQSSGWFTEGNHFTALGDGDLGLGGISIATFRPHESVSLSTTCTTFQLHYLRQPSGGRLRLTDNGAFVSDIDTSAGSAPPAAVTADTSLLPSATGTSAAGTFTYACTAGLHDFTLTTLDQAPVKLFGLVTEQPGITYECLGLNGAVAPLILRWNQALFAEYLRERDPTLIVLAYGTNEAAEPASYNQDYILKFNRLLDDLHRYAPQAAILVLGPYDRAVRAGRGRHAFWQTFAGTERIIADQEESCRMHGCTFYNEQTRMGGPGSMLRWASAGLAQPDHTHLTGTGYRELAQALYADLLAAYTSYQARTVSPAAP